MADLVRLAYYPFLPEGRAAVREAGIGTADVLSGPLFAGARRRALERIEGSLKDGFAPPEVLDERAALLELLSVPVARMLAVHLNEKPLLARYAQAEARNAEARLARDPAGLPDAVAATGIAAEPAEGGGWSMHMATYIRLAPHESSWKLLLRPLKAGVVTVTDAEMARMVREALARRIADELEAERGKPLPDEAVAALAPMVALLQPKLEEAKEAWSSGDFGPVQPHLFPPCVKEVFEALKRSENVPHHGRFAFATFLHTVGWNSEQILDYLAATPNFDRDKSRYQIEHVTGEKSVQAYTPPGCATMQTNGVCPLDKRDGLCARIKHPLSYYRAQLRFQQRDLERAAGQAGPAEAKA